jgi:hypothetical protein
VQASSLSDDFFAWLKMEVIGVGQHHLGSRVGQLFGADPLHSGQGADRHEPRGLYRPMRCVKASAASLCMGALGTDLEVEHGGYRLSRFC